MRRSLSLGEHQTRLASKVPLSSSSSYDTSQNAMDPQTETVSPSMRRLENPPLETEIPILRDLHGKKEQRAAAIECITKNPHLVGPHTATCLGILARNTSDEGERLKVIASLATLKCGLSQLTALAEDEPCVKSCAAALLGALKYAALHRHELAAVGLERLLKNPALPEKEAVNVIESLLLYYSITQSISEQGKDALAAYVRQHPEQVGTSGLFSDRFFNLVATIQGAEDLVLALLECPAMEGSMVDNLCRLCTSDAGLRICRLIALNYRLAPQRENALERYFLYTSPKQVAEAQELLGAILQSAPEICTDKTASLALHCYTSRTELTDTGYQQLEVLVSRGVLSAYLLLHHLSERKRPGDAERMIALVHATPDPATRAQNATLLSVYSRLFSVPLIEKYLGENPPFVIQPELRAALIQLLQGIAIDHPELCKTVRPTLLRERHSPDPQVASAAQLGADITSWNPLRRIRAIFGMITKLRSNLTTSREPRSNNQDIRGS